MLDSDGFKILVPLPWPESWDYTITSLYSAWDQTQSSMHAKLGMLHLSYTINQH